MPVFDARFVVMAMMAGITPLLGAYKGESVAGRAGGFEGATCHACHQGSPVNPPNGELLLGGLPDTYTPGAKYRLTVTLRRPAMLRGGFALTSRAAPRSRRQAGARSVAAGTWHPDNDRVRLTQDVTRKIDYVQHSADGTRATVAGELTWDVEWTAPRGRDTVQFNVAAVAANDDGGPVGDDVYVLERTLRSRGPVNRWDAGASRPRGTRRLRRLVRRARFGLRRRSGRPERARASRESRRALARAIRRFAARGTPPPARSVSRVSGRCDRRIRSV